jgi:hypothetical protein
VPKPTISPLPPVRSFADACCQALAIQEDLSAPVHAAMCLGRKGQHHDLIAVTGWPHRIETVVGYALARRSFDAGFRKLLLFSVVHGPVSDIVEDEVRWFQDVRAELGSGIRPIELLDWLKADADDIRSMAFTVDGDGAWGR